MTIETATPSSLETLAGMFDTLVDHVAARVLFLMSENLDARIAMALDSADLEDKIEASVQTAMDNMDLHDQVLEIVQDLSFDIRVSR
jgi:hypothetical protein